MTMSPSNQQFIHHCIFVFKYNMTRCDRLFKSYMLELSLKITFEDTGVPSITNMSHKAQGSQVETNFPHISFPFVVMTKINIYSMKNDGD